MPSGCSLPLFRGGQLACSCGESWKGVPEPPGERVRVPLQNRVTPFGELVAVPERGLMMGNRGVLHDDRRRIVRFAQVRRWIACRLEFRGRHRAVMTPQRYTELFFLDEAAALAAGHRPCRECRYADYERFRALWNGCFGGPVGADAMDLRLDAERRDGRTKRTYRAEVGDLPDGTYIVEDGVPWLVRGERLFAWSPGGYPKHRPRPHEGEAEVLTPPAIVAVLQAGYQAAMHPSAAAYCQ